MGPGSVRDRENRASANTLSAFIALVLRWLLEGTHGDKYITDDPAHPPAGIPPGQPSDDQYQHP